MVPLNLTLSFLIETTNSRALHRY